MCGTGRSDEEKTLTCPEVFCTWSDSYVAEELSLTKSTTRAMVMPISHNHFKRSFHRVQGDAFSLGRMSLPENRMAAMKT